MLRTLEIFRVKYHVKQTGYALSKIKNSLFGHTDYDKFVVVTRSRTGSNLLKSLLNFHPQVQVSGELFGRINDQSCRDVWNSFFEKKPKKIRCVGFKLFYYHPVDSNDDEIWSLIKKDPEIKIIHLKRINMLRTVVSRKIAGKTDIWEQELSDKNLPVAKRKIKLSSDECIKEFEQIKKWEEETDNMFKNHPLIEITYEDLVRNKQNTMNKIFDFIGVGYSSVESKLKKQNKESLEDLIVNYSQLSESLAQSKWSYLLDLDV